MGRVRTMIGISVFWLALSMLFDGLNTLMLPQRLVGFTDSSSRATTLGLLTFGGLLLSMLIQPVAGLISDRGRPRWGRRGMIAFGVMLILLSLAFFGSATGLVTVFLSYVCLQAAASMAQAAQQGFIPDLIPANRRGMAAGWKGFMDLGGALLAFIVLGQLLETGKIAWALLVTGMVVIITFALTVVLVDEPAPATYTALQRITLIESFRIDVHRHRIFVWLVASRFLFLLGTYTVGRFLLYFVADRLHLDPSNATAEAGTLLAGLTLLTLIAGPPAGWAADRFGRLPAMLAGALLSGTGVLLLTVASSAFQIFLFGSLMALGSAAFAVANWAFTADVAPADEAARFLGLANIGTAGAAAAAGLFGPLVDWGNSLAPGTGYIGLFIAAGLAFIASALALRGVAGARGAPTMTAQQRVG